MGKVNINYQNGNLGGVTPSTDYITGFIFDSTELPIGFTNSTRIKRILSLQDAVNLGITSGSVDETKATGGSILITTLGAVGDYITIVITPKNNKPVTIGTYTVKTGDTILSTATAVVANINLKTSQTGWSAALDGSIIDLVAPSGLGESINGASIISTVHSSSTTFVKTITNFTGGVGSQIDIMYFTLDSYFRANPTSKVYVGIYDFTAGYDESKIIAVNNFSLGTIRQMGVFLKKDLEDIQAIVTASQSACANQASKNKPLDVVLALQPGSMTDAGDLVNLRTLQSPRVSCTIGNAYGEDYKGYNLAGTSGLFPTDLGAVMGHISRSKVGNSIAWVAQNITENTEVMLVTGEEWSTIEDTTLVEELNNKGYIFEGKYIGYAGCYFYNDSVADAFTSDYDSIKRIRTIDKASRIVYTTMVPYLSSPLVLDAATGTMSSSTVTTFVSVLNQAIGVMFNNAEISGFNVYIDPAQNVLVEKNIVITISIVPVGSADTITVNLGYALKA